MNWSKRTKDLVGLLMLMIGVGAMVEARTYNIGTLNHMGPGYFPVVLGAILAGIGGIMLIAAYLGPSGEVAEPKPSQLRGWICIILGVVAFPIIGKYGGFVPATFAIVFISALGERENTLRGITALALAMVAFCIGVFWWGLSIQFPLFGWGNS